MSEPGTGRVGLPLRLNFNVWLAIGMIVFGVAVWLLIPSQVDEPPTMFGQPAPGMSPALFPQMAAAGFVIVGVLYLIWSAKIAVVNGFASLPRSAYLNIGVVLITMIAYVVLLRPLGYAIASSLTALAITLYYGSRNIFGIVIVGIIAPLAIYFLFTRYLSVSLPPFPWSSL
ncbi:tripartite tricarboxylate transporter TctB family protein [Pelagibacterium montanilacus]|uniref:tripartite tricarboxylate transporter TctB family protein n=1 Tax=Pelagibacterium montanilacus TaxID=2185280 RepID=UPI000F8E0BE4|nr:tripartite tricarboxylate transporter TctB family protein [Pelagibacterium montanilacus]